MRLGIVVFASLWLALAGQVRGQTPDDALAAQFNAICAGAGPGTALATRCAEIFAGGPDSRGIAARGNFLGEIPGQGRAATRDGAPEGAADDSTELRQDLGAGWSVFLGADLGWLERRDGRNEADFDGDTGALSAGLDWMPAPDWNLGLVANHTRDELDFLLSDGRMRSDYTGLIGLAGWSPTDGLALDAYAGWLQGDYQVRRAVAYRLASGVTVDSDANADIDADRMLAGLGLTWSVPVGAWEWQLGTGLDWQRSDLDPYSESGGAGFSLRVPGRSITSRRGRLDAALARTIPANWGVWQPRLQLGWRHEFANGARPLAVSFLQDANATAVRFDTDDADTGWGEVGLGSVFVFTGGHSAFVEYRQRIGHDFLQERILALGWRIELP